MRQRIGWTYWRSSHCQMSFFRTCSSSSWQRICARIERKSSFVLKNKSSFGTSFEWEMLTVWYAERDWRWKSLNSTCCKLDLASQRMLLAKFAEVTGRTKSWNRAKYLPGSNCFASFQRARKFSFCGISMDCVCCRSLRSNTNYSKHTIWQITFLLNASFFIVQSQISFCVSACFETELFMPWEFLRSKLGTLRSCLPGDHCQGLVVLEFKRVQKDLVTVEDVDILILGRNECKVDYYA